MAKRNSIILSKEAMRTKTGQGRLGRHGIALAPADVTAIVEDLHAGRLQLLSQSAILGEEVLDRPYVSVALSSRIATVSLPALPGRAKRRLCTALRASSRRPVCPCSSPTSREI